MEMVGPEFYKTHISDSEKIEDAIHNCYEEVMIRKAIILCISDSDCQDLYKILLASHYPVQCILSSEVEKEKEDENDEILNHYRRTPLVWSKLMAYEENPNQILILSPKTFHSLPDAYFEYIMNANHNLLVSNDVPSYLVDKVMMKIQDSHKRGFWDKRSDTYHVLWYMS